MAGLGSKVRVAGFRLAGFVSKVSGLAPGFLQGLGFGSRGSSRGLGSKVWVSFGWFGLQGLWFAGLVWSVWIPRFRVSGFSSECLDSKFGVSGSNYFLAPRFRVSFALFITMGNAKVVVRGLLCGPRYSTAKV